MKTQWLGVVVVALLASASWAQEKTFRSDHTLVSYSGIEETHARAIARIVDAAWTIATREYGFDMPRTITVRVDCKPGNTVRLFNDGQDQFSLSLRSPEDLRRPAVSGIFHVYGLCHEVGHLAMYRPIRDHSWMQGSAAEGWAHYAGSRLVDGVYALAGQDAWCDPYDYRADGMQRLERQLRESRNSPQARGAAIWLDLAKIIGDKQLPVLLKAWGGAKIDPADPGAELREVLLKVSSDPRLVTWWNSAEPALVFRRPASGFGARTLPAAELSAQPVELARDDGQARGKMSLAGGGHAVIFDAPGEGWYLTAMRLYGSRYGMPQPPAEDFTLWLCDEEGKVVHEFKAPYKLFQRGDPKWVRIPLEPTEVPRRFSLFVSFNPTGNKGIYVHHDAAMDGDSRTGLPGDDTRAFDRGDWMIRAVLDQPKSANALRGTP